MIDVPTVLVIQLGFAALFLASACAKLAKPRQFAATVDSYMLVPSDTALAVGTALATVELLAGLTLLGITPLPQQLGLACVGALLLAYAAAMGINLHRGRTGLGCGCSGLGRADAPISRAMVWRNLLLATVALVFTAAPDTHVGAAWPDYLSAAPAVITSLVLYPAFSQHQTNRALLGGMPR